MIFKKIIRFFPEHRKDLLRLLIINTICAVITTFLLRSGDTFFVNWVFSMCIGTSAYALIKLGKYLIWREQEPKAYLFYPLCVALAPLAYLLGVSLAALMFGYPLPNVFKFRLNDIGSFVSFVGLVSIASSWYFWNSAKMAQLQADAQTDKARSAAIERQAMQTQLQLLQAQIEPHMLFNTLANLQGLIALDPARAQHMLEQLIRYLRATLTSSRAEKTTLKQDFELMHAYLELLAIRMGKRLRYSLDLPDRLASFQIPPMLLQPLVENAIKHGLEPKIEGGSVHVSARLETIAQQSFLHLSVQDTGLGLPADFSDALANASEPGQHVGNANIRERLTALYGSASSLRLKSHTPTGAIAEIYIPLQENHE